MMSYDSNSAKSLFDFIRLEVNDRKLDVKRMKPLALAYIGDTIFDLYIRSRIVLTKEGIGKTAIYEITYLEDEKEEQGE